MAAEAATPSTRRNEDKVEKVIQELAKDREEFGRFKAHVLAALLESGLALDQENDVMDVIRQLVALDIRSLSTLLKACSLPNFGDACSSQGISLGVQTALLDLAHSIENKRLMSSEALEKKGSLNSSDDVALKAELLVKALPNIQKELLSGLVMRTEEARLMMLAAMCEEHLLLLGPPGVAKSMLLQRIGNWIPSSSPDGSSVGVFERLLTPFTLPDELFGPTSLYHLKQDRIHRLVDGFLPCATVAFLDEIFKANSAILNALLTIMNERKFDNGRRRVDIPLRILVGASNEYPASDELGALYDRFLFKKYVHPIPCKWEDAKGKGSATFLALFTSDKMKTNEFVECGKHPLSSDVTRWINNEAKYRANVLTADSKTFELLARLNEALRSPLKSDATSLASMEKSKVYVSDRRWLKSLKVLRVVAFTRSSPLPKSFHIELADCLILQHLLWNHHSQQITIRNLILDIIKSSPGLKEGLAKKKEILESHMWLSLNDKELLKQIIE